MVGLAIAVFAVVGGLLIPFVYLFLQHQRKMTALFNPTVQQQVKNSQMESLQTEVAALRDQVSRLSSLLESNLPEHAMPALPANDERVHG